MPYPEITEPFRRLVRIMERLQEPGGCPWDQEQTHESLKPYMIEEAYEALEAIDRHNYAELEEELGDVLLQVIFHAVLAARTGKFSIDQVIETAAAKMVRRHPHVFGDAEAATAGEVLRNWERLKEQERGESEHKTSAFDGVPETLPALLKTQRMQEKAAQFGVGEGTLEESIARASSVLREFCASARSAEQAQAKQQFGRLLFELVSAARALGFDAEDAMRLTSEEFRTRFMALEKQSREQGKPISEL